jgi:hypothetical protein
VVGPGAPVAPAGLRLYLRETLRPDGSAPVDAESERWLGKWSLSLGELNREVLADVERRLSLGDAGGPLATSTAGRYRKIAHACMRRAVELDQIKTDPWPPAPRGAVVARRGASVRRSTCGCCRAPRRWWR